jgi:hypothetical protein
MTREEHVLVFIQLGYRDIPFPLEMGLVHAHETYRIPNKMQLQLVQEP